MKKLFSLYLLLHTSFSFSIAQTEISYGTDPLQKLDYYSASNPNSPIVMVVHGGGWFTGDKSGLPYQNAAQLFQLEGYAVVNINYRLTPNVTYPSNIEDLACALAWTKNNTSLFNGDSSRVAIYGHSAGGHLAAYLGVRPINSMLAGCTNTSGLNVDGVVLTSATVNFDMTNPANWQPIINMLGDTSLYWNIAQPVNHCANNFDTKFLILCGENDNLWISQDSAFHDSLILYSHCSTLKMFLGNDHNSLLENLSAIDPVFKNMTDFLDSLWYGTLCPTTGIESTILSDNFVKIYPNPLTQSTTLIFENPKSENCTLTLYDSYGRTVRKITDIMTGRVEIERHNLKCGLYFFQLQTDKQIIANSKLAID